MFQKIRTYFVAHKIKSIVVIAIICIGGYYLFFHKTATGTTSYVLAVATNKTVVASVSASGQVAATNTVDIKPKASGTITHVFVTAGQQVQKGAALFQLDGADAYTSVRDAQLNLDSALASLKKTQDDDALSVKNAYVTLLSSGLNAVADDAITSKYTPPTISGNYMLGKEGVITLTTYPSVGGTAFTMSGLIQGSGDVSTIAPQPIGDSGLFILFPSSSTGARLVWTITIPNKNGLSYVANKNAYDTAIKNQQDDENPQNTTMLSLQAKRNALSDAQATLADYTVRAPFAGVLANISGTLGSTASSGTSLGTIITQEKMAVLSLNEVDIAKIKMGDKATLTFDALPDLSLTGTVTDIDTIGTVSQGVVSYSVKITLDTNNDSVKPGMSVNAAIVAMVHPDVITVPTSAVKTNAQGSYVEMFGTLPADAAAAGPQGFVSATPPSKIPVTVGISDDTSTEITTGLKEGDQVVSRTIAASATTATTSSAPSLFGAAGARTAGSSAARSTTGR